MVLFSPDDDDDGSDLNLGYLGCLFLARVLRGVSVSLLCQLGEQGMV